jgi:filamentous hemagglutinin
MAFKRSGRDVTLEAQKVDNNGSQNATGTRINRDGGISITAQTGCVIGSSANASGALDVTAEEGPSTSSRPV